jgi:hypothetical protein
MNQNERADISLEPTTIEIPPTNPSTEAIVTQPLSPVYRTWAMFTSVFRSSEPEPQQPNRIIRRSRVDPVDNQRRVTDSHAYGPMVITQTDGNPPSSLLDWLNSPTINTLDSFNVRQADIRTMNTQFPSFQNPPPQDLRPPEVKLGPIQALKCLMYIKKPSISILKCDSSYKISGILDTLVPCQVVCYFGNIVYGSEPFTM